MRDTVFMLDVDGPINGANTGWSCAPHKAWAYAKDKNKFYKMTWSHHLINELRKFNVAYPETIYWATTWCGSTDELEKVFKLPQLLSASPTAMSGDMKLAYAKMVVDSGRRLIWADDEYVPLSGFDYDYLTKDGAALLIKPKNSGKRQGIRAEDMARVFNFMKES